MKALQSLILLLLFVAGISHAQPFYIQLDGKWYLHSQTTPIRYYANLDPALRQVLIPGAIMANCRQPNGQPPIPVGMIVQLGSQDNIIFVPEEALDYYSGAASGGVRYIKIQSPLGDLICDNEVPVPSGGPGDPIFKSGFE